MKRKIGEAAVTRILVAIWVKNNHRLVITTKAPPGTLEKEIDEALRDICIQPIIDVVFRRRHFTLSLEEAEREVDRLMEYARRKRKRFWCIEDRREKLSRTHTLENVWDNFRKTGTSSSSL